MKYISTRSVNGEGEEGVSFLESLLAGFAPDGGLYIPNQYPQFSKEKMEELSYLNYEELALQIMLAFTGDDIPTDVIRKIIDSSYADFGDIEVAPLLQYDDAIWLQEMFFGATYSAKDISANVFSGILDWLTKEKNTKLNLVCASNGDLGSALVNNLAGHENINLFVIYPHNRLSDMQRMPITTTEAKNIFPIALSGDDDGKLACFDDCQKLVREILNDKKLTKKHSLISGNSLSFALILPHIAHFFFAWARLRGTIGDHPLTFSIPRGNGALSYAGYVAMQCGLPINKLLLVDNNNDAVSTFIQTGEYHQEKPLPSKSSGLDIQYPINLERILADVYGRQGDKLSSNIDFLNKTGSLPALSSLELSELQSTFESSSLSDIETVKIMSEADATRHMAISPETALSIGGLDGHIELLPAVALANCHGIKYPHALKEATGKEAVFSEDIDELLNKEESYEQLSSSQVKKYIEKQLKS